MAAVTLVARSRLSSGEDWNVTILQERSATPDGPVSPQKEGANTPHCNNLGACRRGIFDWRLACTEARVSIRRHNRSPPDLT